MYSTACIVVGWVRYDKRARLDGAAGVGKLYEAKAHLLQVIDEELGIQLLKRSALSRGVTTVTKSLQYGY